MIVVDVVVMAKWRLGVGLTNGHKDRKEGQ